MTVIGRFPPKTPTEVVPCTIDFAPLLAEDGTETIVSAVGFVRWHEGIPRDDVGAASMIIGGCDLFFAPLVTQKVRNGTAGVTYEVMIRVTTSKGYVYEECGKLIVKDC